MDAAVDDKQEVEKCRICLTELTNKAAVNKCKHEFCYECLLEWSKHRNCCPLCNARFSSFNYNIKSPTDYKICLVPTRNFGDRSRIQHQRIRLSRETRNLPQAMRRLAARPIQLRGSLLNSAENYVVITTNANPSASTSTQIFQVEDTNGGETPAAGPVEDNDSRLSQNAAGRHRSTSDSNLVYPSFDQSSSRRRSRRVTTTVTAQNAYLAACSMADATYQSSGHSARHDSYLYVISNSRRSQEPENFVQSLRIFPLRQRARREARPETPRNDDEDNTEQPSN